MSANNNIFIADMLIAIITMIAYAYNVIWLQVVFILYLAFVIHFAGIIAVASFKFKSIERFAALTIALDKDSSIILVSSKDIWTRFITYDIPFAVMLICLGQPAISALLIGSVAIIHVYFSQITRLSER
jgi:hypothetical protein